MYSICEFVGHFRESVFQAPDSINISSVLTLEFSVQVDLFLVNAELKIERAFLNEALAAKLHDFPPRMLSNVAEKLTH